MEPEAPADAIVERVDTLDDRGPRSVPRLPTRWLAGLALGVGLLRWSFAAQRRVFHIFPDEAGQLAIARWIGGGTPWKLFDHSTWQPGFALLLAPVYLVTDDPVTVFRMAIGLNAVLGGISAVLLAFVARRLTVLTALGCVGVAAIVSVLPASLSGSAHAWAEPLVSLSFLGAFLAVARFVENERFADGVAALLAGVVGFLAHGRLLLMVVTVVLIVTGIECRRRRWLRAVLGVAVFVASLAAVYALTSAAQEALWENPDRTNTVSATLRRLATDQLTMFDTMIGQLWYLLVSTAGVSFLGAFVLVKGALRGAQHSGDGTVSNRLVASDARALLALLLPQLALSVLFMAGRWRIDQVVYGRYNDAVVLPVLVLGIAWLVSAVDARRRALTLVVAGSSMLATTGYLVLRFGTTIDGERAVREMVAGLVPFYDRDLAGEIVGPSTVALLVLLTIGLTSSMPRATTAWLGGVLMFVTAVAAMSTYHGLAVNENFFESAKQVQEVRALVPRGETLGIRFVPANEPSLVLTSQQRQAAQLYQMYLPEFEFVRDDGPLDEVGPYVFAPRLDQTMLDAGAVALWQADDTGMTLWREQR